MRVGVLGCGSIGRRHLANLLLLGESDLMGYDPSDDARRQAEAQLGVRCSSRLDDLWDWRPKVAFITAPTHLHMPLSIEAAKHGCHLFIEKPLSMNLEGTDRLRAEVAARGLTAMVGCNMRFHPGPAMVKRLLDEGKIGTVLSARIHSGSFLPGWRPQQDFRRSYSANASQGGGVVLDCIHEIDLALWYFGPGAVIGAAVEPAHSIGIPVDGLAEILIRHDSGALSSVHLNFVQKDYKRFCQIIGSDGTLYWDFAEPTVRFYRGNEDPQVFSLGTGWETNQMYLDEVTYFLKYVENEAPTFNDVDASLETLRVAIAAKEQCQFSTGCTHDPASYQHQRGARRVLER